MAAADHGRQRGAVLTLSPFGALTALALLAACGGSGATSKAPRAEALLPAAEAAETQAVAAGPAAAPQVEPRPVERASTLIVIEPPAGEEPDAAPMTLAEAARRERDRRRNASAPIAVIDQSSLGDYAAKGVLTLAAEGPESPAAAEAQATMDKAVVDEAYWRRRGREIRQRWRDAHEQIALLESKAEGLRTRFYSTDDPVVRDGLVKPDWDKAIADLEQARYTASHGAAEVEAFLDEGQSAGALPGWLRDGAELEPEPVLETVDEEQDALEGREPVIYTEPDSPPDSSPP